MRFRRQNRSSPREQGYIMMFLLLTIALMIIAFAAIVPSITFEIKRDKEEEMIHRGTQYSRAIRAYYRKFNRYPAKIEDLENTNQLRFLRKRYKDPLTGKDFRLLHYGEAGLSLNALGGGGIPGANTVGPNGTLNGPGSLNGPGANTGFGNSGSFGANSNSGFATNSNSTFGQQNQAGIEQSQGVDAASSGANSNPSTSATQTVTGTAQNALGDQSSPNQQVFGGAPIVGVASVSKEKTIREFNHKTKYNEWQFIYDPTFDRGFLITTPYQPQLQQFGLQGAGQPLNGQNPGQNGTNNNGFGNTFGNGFGNSPSPNVGNSPPPQQRNNSSNPN